MIAVELTAAIDSAGTTQTFYLADEALITGSGDTPANTAFETRLNDSGSIGRHAYADGRAGGAVRLEIGEIRIDNIDGAFDAWLGYSFDARALVMRSGTPDDPYPAGWTRLLTGTVESVEFTFTEVIVRLRDLLFKLDKALCANTYAGNNSLPNGLEGVGGDIKGRRKPTLHGKALNISPPLVNTSRLIYQVSDGAINTVDAVYDQGAALTLDTAINGTGVYSSQSNMETTAPAAGKFAYWPAGGYFRVGSAPVGQLTADVTQGAAAADRTTAQVLEQIALDMGISAGEISSADVSALDTASSAVVGIWVDDDRSALEAMSEVAGSIGAYFGADAQGVLRMGQLTAPSGTPAVTLYEYDIKEIVRRPPRDHGIPIWRATLWHTKYYTTQDVDLNATVTAVRRAELAERYRRAKSEDATIKTQWLLAGEAEFFGLLTTGSDADTEVARRLALHKVRRDIFDVTVDLPVVAPLAFMSVVRLELDRFSMDAGRDFRVIGLDLQTASSRAVIALWG